MSASRTATILPDNTTPVAKVFGVSRATISRAFKKHRSGA
ncbi:hypothetical protein JOD55_001627 [Arcanobacterium pluranimalium]|nr:hypothetical protein [Arcanobacterium pluranimalium]